MGGMKSIKKIEKEKRLRGMKERKKSLKKRDQEKRLR